MARRIESHMIPGPAGRLESLLEEPETGPPSEAALICHPHPRHGGTMHNKVVYRMARALRRAGAVALRFNYRGVNLSEGAYDHGIGELEDARAALAWLRERYPALPCTVAGFSFGSRIALKLGCRTGAARMIAAGLPEAYHAELAGLDWAAAPKYFVQSTNDEYGPRAGLEAFFDMLPVPKRLLWIDSRDHFFAGGLDALEAAVAALPKPQLASE
jgi:alpha/beta superfamily hydrolase